jgi:hypothetical protein
VDASRSAKRESDALVAAPQDVAEDALRAVLAVPNVERSAVPEPDVQALDAEDLPLEALELYIPAAGPSAA